MAEIMLLVSPPIREGGSSVYYVALSGQGLGAPFSTAKDALAQYHAYIEQGHTLVAYSEFKQAETLLMLETAAAAGH